MWFISIRGDGEARAPDLQGLRGLGSGARCQQYLNEPQLRFLILFCASRILVGCCAAVANNIGRVVEVDIDGAKPWFIAGPTFSS
jgi:hypothetical protein